MRRLEFKDAKSHKFWELLVEGDSYTVRYGKVGSDGQTSTKTCASADKARTEGEKKLASKVKKGYVEVKVDAAAVAARDAKNGPRNPALEAPIFDDPSDAAAWQVYGDWLQQQDDAHGELISLSLQLDGASGKAKSTIKARIAEITAANETEWLGGAAKLVRHDDIDDALELTWQYGYITGISVSNNSEDYTGPSLDKILRALVKAPASLFLRKLTIGTDYDDLEWSGLMDNSVEAVTRAGKLEALTELSVHDIEGYWDISSTSVGRVDKIVAVAPRLRTLYVRGNDIVVERLEHDLLEEVSFETGGLGRGSARAIGRCKLPAATSLTVYFGAEERGGGASVSDIRPLLAGEGVPKLVNLGLCNAEFQDDIARAIAKAPVLKQLETLDMSLGTMSEAGAQSIIAAASAFAHLEQLDLSENFIPTEQCDQLRAALPGVELKLEGQDEAHVYNGTTYYYVSVAE